MKEKKRPISILTIVLIISILFAGCGNGTANPVSTSAEEIQESQSASEASAQPETPGPIATVAEPGEAEASDLPEESVTTEEMGTVTYPLSDETVTLTAYWVFQGFLSIFGVNPETVPELPMFRETEKATNVHLDLTLVSSESFATSLSLLWAAGDYYDLITAADSVYPNGIDSAVEEEILLDIAPYLEEYAPDYLSLLNQYPDFRTELTSDAGRIIAFSAYQDYADGGNVIRMDYLEGLGMDIPETTEDLLEVLRGFKSEYQLKSPLLCDKSMYMLGIWPAYGIPAPGSDGALSWFVKDGEVLCAQTSDEYKEALTWLNQCYSEGLLTDEFLNMNVAMENAIIANDTGFLWALSSALDPVVKAQNGDPNYRLEAIPDITLHAGDTTDVGGLTGGRGASSISISAQTEYPEICVSYLNYFFTEEGRILTCFGVEGETFEYAEDGSKQFTDFIMQNPDGLPSTIAMAVYTGFVGTPQLISKESRLAVFSSPEEIASLDIWASKRTNDAVYYGKLNTEETETFNSLMGDLNTHAESERLKFVTGSRSLDEYETYVNELEGMGIDTVNALKAAAYDRYLKSAAE